MFDRPWYKASVCRARVCTQDLHAIGTCSSTLPQGRHAGQAHVAIAYDPRPVNLVAKGAGMSGFSLSSVLQWHKVVTEMATEGIVFALGMGSTLRDACMAELAVQAVPADTGRATCSLPTPAATAKPLSVGWPRGGRCHHIGRCMGLVRLAVRNLPAASMRSVRP